MEIHYSEHGKSITAVCIFLDTVNTKPVFSLIRSFQLSGTLGISNKIYFVKDEEGSVMVIEID